MDVYNLQKTRNPCFKQGKAIYLALNVRQKILLRIILNSDHECARLESVQDRFHCAMSNKWRRTITTGKQNLVSCR
ncbi:hypothetical protein L596_022093 [Steinernema carpocapsae]|uniref:Uncharacterized protein n=1 Tax=Steinernema carpocapsae TaxID=34508 RepID=A0A4U5MKR6_STECR|nr:hypothetical protein L596_022093 [Steinernema carpocapsae]